MPMEGCDFPSRGNIPQPTSAVVTAAGQRLAVGGEPDGENPTCRINVIALPVAISQTFSVPSGPASASRFPSGENATAQINPVCPW
jgi:hypothetical protein